MKFYKNLIRSFNDLHGHHALLIHTLTGCNFHCYGCHNYEELVLNKDTQPYYYEDDIIEHIQFNGYFFDAIILSGGEFLLESLDQIIPFLFKVKSIFKGIIIINTNGTFPDKIKVLLDRNLVDGIHLDMKLPYHLLHLNNKDDQEVYKSVLGFIPTKLLVDRLITSVHLVIEHNSPYSQIRTVQYPILSMDFFNEIKYFVEALNKNYDTNVPYFVNEFMEQDSS